MMQFREALLQISKQQVLPGEAFLTYCKLCDLCQNAYAEVRKIELFYKIDARLSVISCIQQKRKKAEEELLSSYEQVADLLEEEAYKKLIHAVSETVLGQKAGAPAKAAPVAAPAPQKIHKGRQNQAQPPAPAPKKGGGANPQNRRGTPQGKPAGKARIRRAGRRRKNRRTIFGRLFLHFFGGFSKSSSNRIAPAIVAALYFGGLFLAYWLIASFGAPAWVKISLGIATVTTTAYFIAQPVAGEFLKPDPQQLGFGLVLLVAHPLCRVFFGQGAAFLSACALSTLLAFTILFLVYAIVDDRNAAAGFFAVLVLLGTVSLALSLSFPLAMQGIIGVVASVVFLFVIFLIVQESIDAEYLIPALAALICLLVNAGLFFLFRGNYKIIFFWMAGSSILLSGIHAFNCFDDSEPGFGVFSICNIVLALGSLALPFIF